MAIEVDPQHAGPARHRQAERQVRYEGAQHHQIEAQVTAFTYDGFSETRSYNNVLQLTGISTLFSNSTYMNMGYVYANGQNNGRITQSVDNVAGETVTYTYDVLNRLIAAAAGT